jgi:hypothetical protein
MDWSALDDPTIRETTESRRAEEEAVRHQHPVVQAVLAMFPGATVIPAAPKPVVVPGLAEFSAQAVVNEDGDVVAGETDFTEDDL